MVFNNNSFFVSRRFPTADYDELIKLIHSRGGTIDKTPISSSIIVINSFVNAYAEDKQYMSGTYKAILGAPCIRECAEKYQPVPQNGFVFTTILQGVTISPAGIVESETKEQIKQAVTWMGGCYSEVLKANTNFLVCGENYLKSLKSKEASKRNIPLIQSHWVSDCWKQVELLPIEKYLKPNPVFQDYKICLSGFNNTKKTIYAADIEKYGGTCSLAFSRSCTHLVTTKEEKKKEGKKYLAALEKRKHIVTCEWLNESILKECIQPERPYSLIPLDDSESDEEWGSSNVNDFGSNSKSESYADDSAGFQNSYLENLKVYFSGLNAQEIIDANLIVRKAGGIKYSCVSSYVTHVIIGSGKIFDFVPPSGFSSPFVSIEWLKECEKQGKCIPIDNYEINSSELYTNTNFQQEQQELRQKQKEIESKMKSIEKQRASLSFYGISIYFTLAFPVPKKVHYIQKLEEQGATIISEIRDANTANYAVTPHGDKNYSVDENIKDPQIVTLYWLEACLQIGRILPVSDCIIFSPLPFRPPIALESNIEIAIDCEEEQENICILLLVLHLDRQFCKCSKDCLTENTQLVVTRSIRSPALLGKVGKAALKKKIPVVSQDWLTKSILSNEILPTKPYLISQNPKTIYETGTRLKSGSIMPSLPLVELPTTKKKKLKKSNVNNINNTNNTNVKTTNFKRNVVDEWPDHDLVKPPANYTNSNTVIKSEINFNRLNNNFLSPKSDDFGNITIHDSQFQKFDQDFESQKIDNFSNNNFDNFSDDQLDNILVELNDTEIKKTSEKSTLELKKNVQNSNSKSIDSNFQDDEFFQSFDLEASILEKKQQQNENQIVNNNCNNNFENENENENQNENNTFEDTKNSNIFDEENSQNQNYILDDNDIDIESNNNNNNYMNSFDTPNYKMKKISSKNGKRKNKGSSSKSNSSATENETEGNYFEENQEENQTIDMEIDFENSNQNENEISKLENCKKKRSSNELSSTPTNVSNLMETLISKTKTMPNKAKKNAKNPYFKKNLSKTNQKSWKNMLAAEELSQERTTETKNEREFSDEEVGLDDNSLLSFENSNDLIPDSQVVTYAHTKEEEKRKKLLSFKQQIAAKQIEKEMQKIENCGASPIPHQLEESEATSKSSQESPRISRAPAQSSRKRYTAAQSPSKSPNKRKLETQEPSQNKKRKIHPRFVLTGYSSDADKNGVTSRISQLNGMTSDFFSQDTTHLIAKNPTKSLKFLCACAAGAWILTPEFLNASLQAKAFVDETDFEWNSDWRPKLGKKSLTILAAPSRCRKIVAKNKKKGKSGMFSDWVVLLDIVKDTEYKQILVAGGAKVLPDKPPFAQADLNSVTHCIVSVTQEGSTLEEYYPKMKKKHIPVLNLEFITGYLTADVDITDHRFVVTLK